MNFSPLAAAKRFLSVVRIDGFQSQKQILPRRFRCGDGGADSRMVVVVVVVVMVAEFDSGGESGWW